MVAGVGFVDDRPLEAPPVDIAVAGLKLLTVEIVGNRSDIEISLLDAVKGSCRLVGNAADHSAQERGSFDHRDRRNLFRHRNKVVIFKEYLYLPGFPVVVVQHVTFSKGSRNKNRVGAVLVVCFNVRFIIVVRLLCLGQQRLADLQKRVGVEGQKVFMRQLVVEVVLADGKACLWSRRQFGEVSQKVVHGLAGFGRSLQDFIRSVGEFVHQFGGNCLVELHP